MKFLQQSIIFLVLLISCSHVSHNSDNISLFDNDRIFNIETIADYFTFEK